MTKNKSILSKVGRSRTQWQIFFRHLIAQILLAFLILEDVDALSKITLALSPLNPHFIEAKSRVHVLNQ
jgi:hypothetical protein